MNFYSNREAIDRNVFCLIDADVCFNVKLSIYGNVEQAVEMPVVRSIEFIIKNNIGTFVREWIYEQN